MSVQNVARWIARSLGVVLIAAIVSDFAFSYLNGNYSAVRLSRGEQLQAGLILLAAMSYLFAWRHEKAGGILAIVSGMALACVYWFSIDWPFWPLGTLMALPGFLFLIASRHKLVFRH